MLLVTGQGETIRNPSFSHAYVLMCSKRARLRQVMRPDQDSKPLSSILGHLIRLLSHGVPVVRRDIGQEVYILWGMKLTKLCWIRPAWPLHDTGSGCIDWYVTDTAFATFGHLHRLPNICAARSPLSGDGSCPAVWASWGDEHRSGQTPRRLTHQSQIYDAFVSASQTAEPETPLTVVEVRHFVVPHSCCGSPAPASTP